MTAVQQSEFFEGYRQWRCNNKSEYDMLTMAGVFEYCIATMMPKAERKVEIIPTTCVHFGKDPNVKDEMDRDYDAYYEFLKLNGWIEQERTKLAWCAAMNYARKDSK